MTPPTWVNEHGHRVPTRKCFKCDREWPEYRYRYETLCMNGWKPVKTFSIVNWCGHGHEFQPWLQANSWWLLVPIYERHA